MKPSADTEPPPHLHVVEPRHADATAEGDELVLVDPGEYELAFIKHQVAGMFGRSRKLKLEFRIVTMGACHGKHLQRWCNVKSVKRGGRFTFAPKGTFYREFCKLFGTPSRPDRLSMSRFGDVVIVGRVATVTTDYSQNDIPKGAQYSVIKELLRVCS